MIVHFHKHFKKKYKKLRPNEQGKFKKRLNLLLQDIYNPVLNNHSLTGKYQSYYSINITGNLRALYKFVGPETIIFVIIDTHSNLYR